MIRNKKLNVANSLLALILIVILVMTTVVSVAAMPVTKTQLLDGELLDVELVGSEIDPLGTWEKHTYYMAKKYYNIYNVLQWKHEKTVTFTWDLLLDKVSCGPLTHSFTPYLSHWTSPSKTKTCSGTYLSSNYSNSQIQLNRYRVDWGDSQIFCPVTGADPGLLYCYWQRILP